MDWLWATAPGFLSGLGGCALLLWLGKSWVSERLRSSIKHEYDIALRGIEADLASKLETHKAELDKNNAVDIERLRSDLAIERVETELPLRNLLEKRAEVIEELQDLLSSLQAALEYYINPLGFETEPFPKEKREEVRRLGERFDPYFRRHAVYLPGIRPRNPIPPLTAVWGMRRGRGRA